MVADLEEKIVIARRQIPAQDGSMKMLTEYLERAVEFENLAAIEENPAFKSELLKQAADYRKLAAERAEQYGLPMPSSPATDATPEP
jgi:hypothetical protein